MSRPRSRYQSTSYDTTPRTSFTSHPSSSHSVLCFYPIMCTHLTGVYIYIMLVHTTLDQDGNTGTGLVCFTF